MTVCEETGETAQDLVFTVSCGSNCNPETGEREKRSSAKSTFRVPYTPPARTSPKKLICGQKCCGGAYVITLGIITLMMISPSSGISVWLALEVLYHMWTHQKPGLYQHPLHVFFFSEFCGYCQSKVRMHKVQRLQDRRYKHYMSNISVAT